MAINAQPITGSTSRNRTVTVAIHYWPQLDKANMCWWRQMVFGQMQKYHKLKWGEDRILGRWWQCSYSLIKPTFLNKRRARVFKSAPGSSLPMYSIPDNQCSRFETDFCSSSPHIGSHAELHGVAPATSYISHRLPVEATYLTADYEVYLAITPLKELTAHLHQDDLTSCILHQDHPRSERIIHQTELDGFFWSNMSPV